MCVSAGRAPLLQFGRSLPLHTSSLGAAGSRPPWKVRLMSRSPQRPLAATLAVARLQLVKGFPAPPEKLAGAPKSPGRSRSRGDRLVRSLCALGKFGSHVRTTGPGVSPHYNPQSPARRCPRKAVTHEAVRERGSTVAGVDDVSAGGRQVTRGQGL